MGKKRSLFFNLPLKHTSGCQSDMIPSWIRHTDRPCAGPVRSTTCSPQPPGAGYSAARNSLLHSQSLAAGSNNIPAGRELHVTVGANSGRR